MSHRIKCIVLATAACSLIFGGSTDCWAQFSRIQRVMRQPQNSARGFAQQVLSQAMNAQPSYQQPTYQQPRYQQPGCAQPTYVPPVYTKPMPTVSPVVAKPKPVRTPTPVELARISTEKAKSLFKKREYSAAEKQLDEVIKQLPKNADAYQFRSLTHFTQSDWANSAADAYDAMSNGNTWTRDVLKSVYGPESIRYYDNQLRQLKRVVELNPSMQSHFLLAYHHLVNGQWEEGKIQLEEVLALQPQEQLSRKLLSVVNTKIDSENKSVALGSK